MPVTRRDLLTAAAAVGASGVAVTALYGSGRSAFAGAARFQRPLAIPPLLQGEVRDGVRRFDLTLQRGQREFLDGMQTPTAGINGAFLGPVIRVRRGEQVRLDVANRLGEASTLHWHGVHLPAKMDGGPHQVIEAGATWSPRFRIRQPASTQWYHSHLFHRTGVQVYYGLAGLFYIDDDQGDALGLPSDHGVDDIPLVLQDRSFARDGSFRYLTSMHDRMLGMTGDVMLVNGVVLPFLRVRRRLTRFRILNGSNARIYNLAFSDGRRFLQIASDGGLLPRPVPLTSVRLSPGERAEILLEMTPEDDLQLVHVPPPARRARGGGMMGMMQGMMRSDDQPFSIMRLIGSGLEDAGTRPPRRLVEVPAWSEDEAVKTRRFVLEMGMGMMGGGGFRINGRAMDMNRIDETVRLGAVEIWEIVNRSPMAHPFHIHDIQFRILDRDGRPPPAGEQGLKDTVLVEPQETVRVITRFEHYADADSPYMFHCHILEHEDAGMMGQFVVVA
ncbi:MAG TPA: oxidase [Sedimenticola thiotaurini]|uniref:Multicopper oxidase CueO n=1 Tax=Sedimenticola thiotaurini TaxID=1543721 RepID=A0A831RNG1_9GAMM|nr:oxidase [Sedimenticola thiotaurini]